MLPRFLRFSTAVAICLGACAYGFAQIADDPVTVPVQFQGLYTASGGSPSVSISLDSSHFATSSGAPSGQTTNGIARIRPGRNYTFTITQSAIQRIQVKFTPASNYRVFINGVEHEMFDWTPPNGSNGYFTVRVDDGSGAAVGEAGSLRPGRVLWSVGLGNLKNGKPAGSLMIAEDGLTADTFKPAALFYDRDIGVADGFSDEGEVRVIKPGNVLRQVYAATVLADITTINDHAYYIRLYPRDTGQIGDFVNGAYQVSGTALYEFKIENPTYPSLDALRITKTVNQAGAFVTWSELRKQSTGVWLVQDWVDKPVGATTVSSPVQQRWTYTNSDKDELMEVVDGATNATVRRVFRHYDDISFGFETSRELSYEEFGSGTTVRTDYSYHTSTAGGDLGAWHKIKQITSTDGSWTAFDYENDYWARGKIKEIRRPFKDAPTADPGTGSTSGEVLRFTYFDLDAFGTKYLNQIDKFINGATAGKTVFSYAEEWITDYSSNSSGVAMPVVVVTRKDYSNSTDYLTTYTRTYRQDADPDYKFFRGLPHSVIRPDGTATVMAYFRADFMQNSQPFYASTTGGARVHVAVNGTTDASMGMVLSSYPGAQALLPGFRIVSGKSTRSLTLMDPSGLPKIAQSEAYVASVWTPVRQDWIDYINSIWPNQVNRRTSATTGDSTWRVMDRVWVNGRVQTNTDETGLQQTMSYDEVGRLKSATRQAASYNGQTIPAQTVANTYDAAGGVLSQVLSGGGTSDTITRTWSYDQAGRVLTENAPRIAQTSYLYDVANRKVTVTLPSVPGASANRIEQRYIDGQIASVGGTGVAEGYDYAPDGDLLQSTLTVGVASRTRKVWVDWLGRQKKTQVPRGPGASEDFTETINYDVTKGRVTSVDRSGYASTLYVYDGMSQVVRSGLDVNGGGLQDISSDRITEGDTVLENYLGAVWAKSEQSVFPTVNSSDKKSIGTTRKRITGLSPTLRSELRVWDADGVQTTRTLTVSVGESRVTSTTTRDGYTGVASEQYLNGFLIASTGFDALIYKRNYDGLGRLTQEIDPRTGTTTTTYYPNSTFVYEVLDPKPRRLSRIQYDEAGRPTVIWDVDGKTTRRAYNARGQLLYQWGSAVQPVSFTYDSATGERTKMWTYQSDLAGVWDADASTAWPGANATFNETRWEYDAASGLLTKKYDAANLSVDYSYNNRGQTATRTWARTLSGSGTRLQTTYTYDGATGELTNISYNDDVAGQPVRTKPVKYTYTRLGQIEKVWDDSTGAPDSADAREFVYDPSQPTRLYALKLPALYNNASSTQRQMTRRYDGIWRGRGFMLGTASSLAADLDQILTFDGASGRLASLSTAGAGITRQFNYGYLANSSLVQTVTSDSFTLTRGYESDRDLLKSIEAKWGTASKTKYDYTYNELGQRSSTRQGGEAFKDYWEGVTGYTDTLNVHTYNSRGELEASVAYSGNGTLPAPDTSLELPGRRFKFTYDRAGNRKTAGPTGKPEHVDDMYQANNLNQYTWKENNTVRMLGTVAKDAKVAAQSTGATNPIPDITKKDTGRAYAADISPDNAGHAKAGTLSVYAAAAGSANTVSRVEKNWVVPPQTQHLSYDLDGNLTEDEVWKYEYDAENRLVRITTLSVAAGYGVPNRALDFKYDYLGRRVEKKVTDLSTNTQISCRRYLYDGWDLVAEIAGPGESNAGSVVRSYTWGLDIASTLSATGGVGALLQITHHGTGKVYCPTYDGNGNIASLIRVSDSSGVVAAAYEYGPFGEALRAEAFDSEIADQPFRFSTKFFDGETGLTYYGARFYSADLGRFINSDPIAEAGGLNLNGFCANDGINRVDHLGYSWLSDAIKKVKKWVTTHKQELLTVAALVASIYIGGWVNSAIYQSNAVNFAAATSAQTAAGSLGTVTVVANGGILGGAVSSGAISAATASTIGATAAAFASSAASSAIMGASGRGALRAGLIGALSAGVAAFATPYLSAATPAAFKLHSDRFDFVSNIQSNFYEGTVGGAIEGIANHENVLRSALSGGVQMAASRMVRDMYLEAREKIRDAIDLAKAAKEMAILAKEDIASLDVDENATILGKIKSYYRAYGNAVNEGYYGALFAVGALDRFKSIYSMAGGVADGALGAGIGYLGTKSMSGAAAGFLAGAFVGIQSTYFEGRKTEYPNGSAIKYNPVFGGIPLRFIQANVDIKYDPLSVTYDGPFFKK